MGENSRISDSDKETDLVDARSPEERRHEISEPDDNYAEQKDEQTAEDGCVDEGQNTEQGNPEKEHVEQKDQEDCEETPALKDNDEEEQGQRQDEEIELEPKVEEKPDGHDNCEREECYRDAVCLQDASAQDGPSQLEVADRKEEQNGSEKISTLPESQPQTELAGAEKGDQHEEEINDDTPEENDKVAETHGDTPEENDQVEESAVGID